MWRAGAKLIEGGDFPFDSQQRLPSGSRLGALRLSDDVKFPLHRPARQIS
jgi:hypothetical protein